MLIFPSFRNQQSYRKIPQNADTLKISIENKINTIIKDTIIFQSGSNGLADIKLVIIPDGNFAFHMRTIPQPMTEEEEVIINSTGTWLKKDNWIILDFIKNKSFFLKAVFDSNYADENEFKVINESTVAINITLKQLYIWGVACDKVKE